MKLGSQEQMTPEFVVASSSHTRAEKLELLEGMRRKALAGARGGAAEEAAPSVGTIDRAIDKVKSQAETEDEDRPDIAIGRATSA